MSFFFFDMDGTLLDSNGLWREVDRTFLSRRGFPYTHAYYEGVAHTTLPKAAEFTRAFLHLNESCDSILSEWMALAENAYQHVNVKPGVRAYLKQCRSENRSMAVITSSVPEQCRMTLKRLDLLKYFEEIFFAQELGLEKQAPDIWRLAAKHFDVRPEDCTVFDDSLAACKGARAAKFRVIGVYDKFFEKDQPELQGFCDVYIRSFEELLLPERKKR